MKANGVLQPVPHKYAGLSGVGMTMGYTKPRRPGGANLKGLIFGASQYLPKGGTMRKVIYSGYTRISGVDICELEEKGEALFHQWGMNYEEFEQGAGNFSTAIIELEDGTVKNIPAEHVRFISGEIEKEPNHPHCTIKTG